jgi:hypothetical protein|tara:strand:- start:511 stop:699 length:189 start_codon:yes stop_codon:yes gene_type:complete
MTEWTNSAKISALKECIADSEEEIQYLTNSITQGGGYLLESCLRDAQMVLRDATRQLEALLD